MAREIALPPISDEELAIAVVQNAAKAAFDPSGERGVGKVDLVRAIAAIDSFLEQASGLPPRSFAEWRVTIGELKLVLGSGLPTEGEPG